MNKIFKMVAAGVGVVAIATSLIVGRHLLIGENASGGNRVNIAFYGWGNESEVALTHQFVDEFNKTQDED